MMKISVSILVLLSFAFGTSNAADRPYIISGLDDVLRQAHGTDFIKSAVKLLENDRTFAGMPELYTVISSQEKNPPFVLVSAISSFFDSRIRNFLIESRYPDNQRYFRSWLTQWSIEEFKVAKVTEIMDSKPGRKFIIVLDNSDASIAFADRLSALFPDRINAIYLRQVVEKPNISSAKPFFTAFDIAFAEFSMDRLSAEEVVKVGGAIIAADHREKLFPRYAQCPSQYQACPVIFKDTQAICEKVQSHIRALCRNQN